MSFEHYHYTRFGHYTVSGPVLRYGPFAFDAVASYRDGNVPAPGTTAIK